MAVDILNSWTTRIGSTGYYVAVKSAKGSYEPAKIKKNIPVLTGLTPGIGREQVLSR